MRLKSSARRFISTPQFRPSTGITPQPFPVDGDYPSPLAQHTPGELIRALARNFATTDSPDPGLKSEMVGDVAVGGAEMDQSGTIRPSRDPVSRSLGGDRT